MTLDGLFIIILFVLCSAYSITIQTQSINTGSILNHRNSIIFECIEIVGLVLVSFFLYKQKQFILSMVFMIELLEHMKQIFFCYRQTSQSSKITILFDVVFMIYAYLKKCYWVIPFFMFCIVIHIISIALDKAFTGIVCIS